MKRKTRYRRVFRRLPYPIPASYQIVRENNNSYVQGWPRRLILKGLLIHSAYRLNVEFTQYSILFQSNITKIKKKINVEERERFVDDPIRSDN